MTSPLRIAIVGATGAVGQEFLRLFEARNFSISHLSLLASARSIGNTMHFRGESLRVTEATAESVRDHDIVFMSAGASRSREFAPPALESGATVIDNSSAFRMDPAVPLVVPEINFAAIRAHDKLIANPNCSAIIMLMAVAPLRKLGTIKRIIVSTYQSASGAGAKAMEELTVQTRDVLEGRRATPQVMPHVYAFNLFSHNTPVDESGYNEEERKMIEESQKILDDSTILINPTCIRVPVLRAHSESITVEFADTAPPLDAVRNRLQHSEGVKLVDDREANTFPMPLSASGENEVLVGRLRHDISNPRALSLFVAGDQLLKGASLNAVQIAERLLLANRWSKEKINS